MRIYISYVKKRQLLEKGYVRAITRALRIILFFVVFFSIMRVIGVELHNVFDFIGTVLTFKIFSIGTTDISLLTLIVIVVVVYASAKLAKLVRGYLTTTVFPRFKIEPGLQFSL